MNMRIVRLNYYWSLYPVVLKRQCTIANLKMIHLIICLLTINVVDLFKFRSTDPEVTYTNYAELYGMFILFLLFRGVWISTMCFQMFFRVQWVRLRRSCEEKYILFSTRLIIPNVRRGTNLYLFYQYLNFDWKISVLTAKNKQFEMTETFDLKSSGYKSYIDLSELTNFPSTSSIEQFDVLY